MSAYKTGRWSNEELKYTKELVEQGLSYEQIAEKINRPPETIKQCVEDKLLMNLTDTAKLVRKVEFDIKNSLEWRELAKQISPDEQDLFIYHWREILAQFNNDVAHTERLQIIDVVRIEILMNRVLVKINDYNNIISNFQSLHTAEMFKDPLLRNTQNMLDYQKRIAESTLAIGQLNKELSDLHAKKSNVLKDIKGTREQRVKRIEESKETFNGLVAAILDSPELRTKWGRYMEKFRIAKDVQFEKMSEYHEYADGEVEQPLLSSETLKDDNI